MILSRGVRQNRGSASALVVALLSSASLWVIAPSVNAAEAAAASADDGATLEAIVVTAEKRESNLQKTPISISVLGANDLVDRHAQSLEDLMDGSVPSLRVAPFFARNSALTIGMRGIGALGDANQPARDQAVGVYIDGVYLGRAQGLGSALYDVARIEVLKGPQGTLFGRNTEGGAISIVTKAPTGRFGLDATGGFGNFDSYKLAAHLDLPSVHDVSFKVDALVSKRSGTVTNPAADQPDFNSYDKRGLHGEALWKPSDRFSADYAFDVSRDATTPYYAQLLAKGVLFLPPAAPTQPDRADSANVGAPLNLSVGDTSGHRLTLDWKLASNLDLKSVSSYRKLNQSQFDNGETALSAFAPNGKFSRYSLAKVYQNQYSEELQLVGNLTSIEFAAGAFFYHEWVKDNAQTPNSLLWNATGTASTFLPLDLNTVPYDRASHVTTESSGAFGQATWTPPVLEKHAHLTVGGRFTHDSKTGSLDVVNGAVPSYVDANKTKITGTIPLDKSWDRFDPMVNLAYDVTPDVDVYGKWSTGYKAGGANSRSLTYRAFNPETVSMFELGAKSEWLDHHVRLNVAAYTGDLKDVQVDFSVLILNNNRGTLETTNAATGTTKGVEAELTWLAMKGLTFTANYTYTDISLSQAFNPFTNTQSVVYPLYTPKNAGSIAADYERPFMGANLRTHLDANFADGQFTSTTDPTLSDKSLIVNGRVALTNIRLPSSGADLQLSVWARNLTDEKHVFLKNTNSILGVYGIYNEPRTVGAELNVKY